MRALRNVILTERSYTDIETAKILGLSAATIRRWRLTGMGPKYRKFGGAVRYSHEDIEAYINGAPSGGGAEASRNTGREARNSPFREMV